MFEVRLSVVRNYVSNAFEIAVKVTLFSAV